MALPFAAVSPASPSLALLWTMWNVVVRALCRERSSPLSHRGNQSPKAQRTLLDSGSPRVYGSALRVLLPRVCLSR
jgi:hypothetical protein